MSKILLSETEFRQIRVGRVDLTSDEGHSDLNNFNDTRVSVRLFDKVEVKNYILRCLSN